MSLQITATDMFCGAGGTSSGVKKAGAEVKMAMNHWEMAIETHNTNHPEADHDCADISATNVRRYPSTTILCASPECTNHSLAKGRKKSRGQMNMFAPAEDPEAVRSRATMWDIPRFAEFHEYQTIIVENVVDVRDWAMWNPWLMAMHALGYKHKCLYLNSMFFHPCPQSRDRIYIVFWKKGNKAPNLEFRPVGPCPNCGDQECVQVWKRKNRQFGRYGRNGQYLYHCSKCGTAITPYYYCALNAIDFTVPITRIGDRKRPLVQKTIDRIQHGLNAYKGKELRLQQGERGWHVSTVPAIASDAYDATPRDITMPLSAQTTRQDKNLMLPPAIVTLRRNSNTKAIDKALTTITAGAINHALLMGNYTPGWARALDKPTGTMTTIPQQSLVTTKALSSFLSYYYGKQQQAYMSAAIGTVTTRDRAALVMPDIKVEDCYYRVLKPHEVQVAMAFSDDYIILGNSRQKVKQLGNAVTPPVMEWIIKRVIEALA